MKLHLPCKLLASVLACICTAALPTLGADIISMNFCTNNGALNGTVMAEHAFCDVNCSLWNNITGYDNATINQYKGHELTDNHGEATATLSLTVPGYEYPFDMEQHITHEDPAEMVSASLIENWTVKLDTDYMFADITLYLSTRNNSEYSDTNGTPDSRYAAVSINGDSYSGAKVNTDLTSDLYWGKRYYQETFDDNNMFTVTNVKSVDCGGHYEIAGAASAQTPLAALQVTDSTAENVWTVAGDMSVGSDSTLTKGTGDNQTTSPLGSIESGDRYLGFTDQAITFSGSETVSLDGLHATGAVTVKGAALDVPLLFAKKDATLDVQSMLADDSNINIKGLGSVTLSADNKLGRLSNMGNLVIAGNSSITSYDAASTGGIKVATGGKLTYYVNNVSGTQTPEGSIGELVSLWGAAGQDETHKGKVHVSSAGEAGIRFTGDVAADTKVDLRGNYSADGDGFILESNQTLKLNLQGSMEMTKLVLGKNQNFTLEEGAELNLEKLEIGEDANVAAFTISGGKATIGSVEVKTGSSLTMTGGALELSSGSIGQGARLLGGTMTIASGASESDSTGVTLGALTIEHDGNFRFTETVTLVGTVNNSVSATSSETEGLRLDSVMVDTGKLDAFEHVASLSEGDNGYEHGERIWLVKNDADANFYWDNTSTITYTDASMIAESEDDKAQGKYVYVADAAKGAYLEATGGETKTVYHVRTGTVDYKAGSQIADSGTTGIVVDGGTLSFAENAPAVPVGIEVRDAADKTTVLAKFEAKGEGTEATPGYKSVTVTTEGISGTPGEAATVTDVSIKVSGDYAISNVTLEKSALSTEGTGALTLTNVHLDDTTAKGSITLAGVSSVTLGHNSDTAIRSYGMSQDWPTYTAIAGLETGALEGVTLAAGAHLELDLSGDALALIKALVKDSTTGFESSLTGLLIVNKNTFGIQLSGFQLKEDAVDALSDGSVTLGTNLSALSFGITDIKANGNSTDIYFTLGAAPAVPEPATATLSLLALAALAARRRRK